MDKYLIVGLGNVGDEYDMTRHNTGFMVLDALAKASNISFSDKRYGFVAETSIKVGELSFEGLTLSTPAEVVVCSVKATRASRSAAAAAAQG